MCRNILYISVLTESEFKTFGGSGIAHLVLNCPLCGMCHTELIMRSYKIMRRSGVFFHHIIIIFMLQSFE